HDPRRLFDLFCPQPPRAGGVPLLVFIHGGLWRAGDKSEHAALAKAWASSPDHPVAVAVVNYRLSAREGRPVRYPDHVQDCAAAVKWFRGPGRAQCYGYDPDRIFLVGHSSGAQLAGVLVLNPRWLGEDWRAVRGVVGVQGLYDLPGLVAAKPGLLEFVEGAFGPRAEEERRNWIYASPQYLKLEKQYRMPPWLLVHSPEDDALPPDGTAKFRDHLRALVAAEPGNAGGRDGPEVRVQMVTQASGSHYEVLLGGEFAALVASFVDSV
ncbi:Alpha/Beta hydrolase protein, partial [Hyaloraphidium curvatum]